MADTPVITSQASTFSLSIASGAPVAVTTMTASDGDNDILTWTLSDIPDPSFAGDSSFFAIDSNGLLQLTSIPNPLNNPYQMLVQVSDGQEGSDFQTVQITLINDAVSAQQSTVSVSAPSRDSSGNETVDVTVTLNSANGSPVTNAGNIVEISASGSATVGPVTNNGDGTYTASVTSTAAGAQAVNITITAAGVQLNASPSISFAAPQTIPPEGDSGTSSGGGGSTGWLLLAMLGLSIRGRGKLLATVRG